MSAHLGSDTVEPLTARELELLRLLAAGLSNPQIAYQLHLTVNTVKVHLRHTFAKLNVDSRAAAIAQANRPALLDPAPGRVVQPISRHNLPEYLTPFIGRTQELQEIATTLDTPGCRLLRIIVTNVPVKIQVCPIFIQLRIFVLWQHITVPIS